MVNINKLMGKFVEKGYSTKKQQAGAIGMSIRTYNNKLNSKIFNSDEIFKIMEVLNIDDPTPIFFVKNVS
ncbi:DUF739 family protein [Fusobacterium pseudoperiodonticum]|jgi:hypothetical protein|uniref:DUF739 family protein n=1 Tax=Fusobacterium TaxID=848 RepID=UPI0028D500A5|nr:DUF739 family protein [Fusobacterium pseudoperiodonticum]